MGHKEEETVWEKMLMSQYLEKKERDKCEGNKRNLKMKQNKIKQTPPKQNVYTVNH